MFCHVDVCVLCASCGSSQCEIGQYEVPREEALPGLGMTIDDFQIARIQQSHCRLW